MLAFKACYYGLRAARRLGWRPGADGMVRVAAPAGAEPGGTVPATAR
ncbi:MAG: hypothetical protein ICV73_19430 [Acetobacteraceae bacterium]|nr:hypothetical protein [Acetobacteraceae bacterium]